MDVDQCGHSLRHPTDPKLGGTSLQCATDSNAVARNEFSIPIARTMALKDAAEGHRLAEKGGVAGKIILVP